MSGTSREKPIPTVRVANDIIMIIAGRRYGDWRHVAMGCTAPVRLNRLCALALTNCYHYSDLQIDERRLTDWNMTLSRLILPSRPLANELCLHITDDNTVKQELRMPRVGPGHPFYFVKLQLTNQELRTPTITNYIMISVHNGFN